MNVNEPQQTEQRAVGPDHGPPPELDDPRLIAALEEYLEAAETGEKPNRQAFLARHADIAEALAGCLEGMEALNVASSSASATGNAGAPAPAGGWQAGTVVGDFRIVREVGRGGMGVVYEAEQVSLGRRIALKVLPFAFTLDSRQLQRFKNEARAAAHLHHSNIVPVYSVGCESGVHFYAMQYIEGQTLAEVIQQLRQLDARGHASAAPAGTAGRRLGGAGEATGRRPQVGEATGSYAARSGERAPAGETAAVDTAGGAAGALATAYSTNSTGFFRAVAKLGVQAAEALEHAHAYGVVHRDIKPGNLMVDVSSHLWVTDFGLALLQGDAALTRTGDLLGTLRYMSPEQALARRGVVDHRTDIYSLGVTLYELLTREPPYDGSDRQELLRQIAFEEPRAPRRWNSQIPADLETIVLKAMARGLEERYATAQELAEDLRRFLEHKPIQARRPTLLERSRKWARRHTGMIMSAVGVLLLLAVSFAVSTVLVAQEQWNTKAANELLAMQQAQTKRAYEQERQRAQEAREAQARSEKSFRKAREVVDFLTQVSEKELANNPFFTDLRRRLLETALVYYQGFVDDRQNELASQPDLTAARERVAAILGELYASEGFWRVMFLTRLLDEEAVQKDLGLTKDQAKNVQHQAGDLFRKFAPSLGTFRQLSPDTRRNKLQEMTRAAEKSLADILTPRRVERLKQIALQQRGPEAWSDPEVAEELGFRDTQKQQIRTIQAEARKKRPAPPPPGREPTEDWNKWTQYMNACNRQLLGVLTAVQKARWDEMIGKPLQGEFKNQGFKRPFGCRQGPPKDRRKGPKIGKRGPGGAGPAHRPREHGPGGPGPAHPPDHQR